jgi:hypothetical protein
VYNIFRKVHNANKTKKAAYIYVIQKLNMSAGSTQIASNKKFFLVLKHPKKGKIKERN